MEKEETINSLVDLIKQQADERILEIQRDFELNRQMILDEYKRLAEDETNIFIEQELVELKEKILQSGTQAKWKIKKDLFIKRQMLVDQLFEEVNVKIKQFVQSDKYPEWIKSRLLKIEISEDAKLKSEIRCRKEDVTLFYNIEKTLGFSWEIITNDDIQLGGFIFTDPINGIEKDQTLDYKLRVQKEWFYANSKLNF